MSTKSLISVPQGVEVKIEDSMIVVKGPKAELRRIFPFKVIEIVAAGGNVEAKPKNKTANARAMAGAFTSHLNNMIHGVQTPYVYTLKITFTHFPITVVVSGLELQVQNFLGEKKPRKVTLPQHVKVSVQGDIIKVESADLELAGKAATLIEQATRVTGRDRRVFQDGIYITQKGKVR
jgi:large subunit ribosomal protein L6